MTTAAGHFYSLLPIPYPLFLVCPHPLPPVEAIL